MSNWLTEKCEAVRRSTIRKGAVETVSGYAPLALPGSTGERVRMMTVYGRSVQNGTPAPDAPVSVVGVQGKVRSRGKNLFDINGDINSFIDEVSIYPNNIVNGVLIASNGNADTNARGQIISIVPGITYTVSCVSQLCGDGSQTRMRIRGLNKVTINTSIFTNASPERKSFTFTATSEKVFLDFIRYNASVNTIYPAMFSGILFEQSSTATPYAPYASPSIITHPTLHGIPLASTATDYTYIDSNGVKYAADTWTWREEGVWEHVQRVGVYTPNLYSLDTSSYVNLNVATIYKATDDVKTGNISRDIPVMCNKATYQMIYKGFDREDLINCIYDATIGRYFVGVPKSITTLSAAQEYLSGLIIYYQLATPIVTQYTHAPWMHTIDASHAGNPLDVAYLDNVDGTTTVPFITASYYKEVVI